MGFSLGNSGPPSTKAGDTVNCKFILFVLNLVYFNVEAFINGFQTATLRDQREVGLTTGWEDHGRWRILYRNVSAWYEFCLVLVVGSYNVVAMLWDVVGEWQVSHRVFLTGKDGLGRTVLFLAASGVCYALLHIPNFLVRTLVFGDDVLREIGTWMGLNGMLHDLASGRSTRLVVLLVALEAMAFQACGAPFAITHLYVFVVLQTVFIVSYPLLSQPNQKSLSLLEHVETREGIEEAAAVVGFPLQNIYIVEREAKHLKVQTIGWPRKKDIVIHASLLDEYSTEEIVALVVHKLAWWKINAGFLIFTMAQLSSFGQYGILMFVLHTRDFYKSFGFGDDLPTMAMLVLWVIGLARPVGLMFWRPFLGPGYVLAADKMAAEFGYGLHLSMALPKAIEISSKGEKQLPVSKWYFMFHYEDQSPALSERLTALEKFREAKGEKEGMVALLPIEKQ